MTSMIKKESLPLLLDRWGKKHQLFTPQKQYGESMLLPHGAGSLDLDYINFSQPVKEFLTKQKELLFSWEGDTSRVTLEGAGPSTETTLIFGVRACDTYGIAFLDKFFQEEFPDDIYIENRKRTLIVALNCSRTAETCFCASQGTGPFADTGCDLIFTPLDGGYLIEEKTTAGTELMAENQDLTFPADDDGRGLLLDNVLGSFQTRILAEDVAGILRQGYKHPIWDELAAECIRCGGCTNVCPTCTCFNVVEERTDDGHGRRYRCVDSCQCDSFTRNAGGHKPRSDAARVRYRIYDKLKYIEDRFGHKGCTGCGRCVTACPVDIHIVRTINLLATELTPSPADPLEKKFEIHSHQDCEQVYLPQIAVIEDIIDETRSIKRFVLRYENQQLHDSFQLTGQFFEITVFGVGEIAISVPFPASQTQHFDFCVKNVGKVTQALHEMKPGDRVGLRGPFGKGFPYEQMKGRDILIIGSGVGIAPVRTIVMQIAEEREQFGNVSIIGSAMSYEGLIYKQDFIDWKEHGGMNVMYAFNKPTDLVEAHVGYINDLLPGLSNDWSRTTAIICASPRRIKEVAKDLLKLGMSGTDIYTSLETHMRCGIGKCGHCKVGNKYMCVDGPVFNYEEMLMLPQEF